MAIKWKNQEWDLKDGGAARPCFGVWCCLSWLCSAFGQAVERVSIRICCVRLMYAGYIDNQWLTLTQPMHDSVCMEEEVVEVDSAGVLTSIIECNICFQYQGWHSIKVNHCVKLGVSFWIYNCWITYNIGSLWKVTLSLHYPDYCNVLSSLYHGCWVCWRFICCLFLLLHKCIAQNNISWFSADTLAFTDVCSSSWSSGEGYYGHVAILHFSVSAHEHGIS